MACGLDTLVKRLDASVKRIDCVVILLAAGGTFRLFLSRWQLHVVELVCRVRLRFRHVDKFSCFLAVCETFKQWALIMALSTRPDGG